MGYLISQVISNAWTRIKAHIFAERINGRVMKCGLIEQPHDERDYRLGWFFGGGYKPKHKAHEIKPLQVRDQSPFNTCTQQSAAAQKEIDEGVLLSTRYLTVEAKKKGRISGDGFASLRDIQQTVVESGVCEASMLPDDKSGGWQAYSDPSGVQYCQQMNGILHRSKSYVRVSTSDEWFKALDDNRVIQTGMRWYSGYNLNGGLTAPWVLTPNKGVYLGGHAINCIGYDNDKQLFKFLNSYGSDWGDNGCFYIRYSDWWAMGPYGYVSYDVSDVNPAIIQYEGKFVKSDGDPRIFKIEDGKKRWFPTEKEFFFHGGKFNPPNFVRISGTLLNVIPDGPNMTTDVSFKPNL